MKGLQDFYQDLDRSKKQLELLPERVWSYKPNAQKWSRKEILGHLCDSARFNLMRFANLIHQDEMVLYSYPQDDLVQAQRFQSQPTHWLISQWYQLNHKIIELLEQDGAIIMNKQVLIEKGQKNWSGQQLIEDYIHHFHHHMTQILEPFQSPSWIFPYDEVLNQVKTGKKPFFEVFRRGSVSIELYAPDQIDRQQPHDQDEIYVVASGTGFFIKAKEIIAVKMGDAIWVPAQEEHRFIDFSADFAVWVIFY